MEPNTSQGCVAANSMFGGIPKQQIVWRIFQRKNYENRLKFDRIIAMSLMCSFLAHPADRRLCPPCYRPGSYFKHTSISCRFIGRGIMCKHDVIHKTGST